MPISLRRSRLALMIGGPFWLLALPFGQLDAQRVPYAPAPFVTPSEGIRDPFPLAEAFLLQSAEPPPRKSAFKAGVFSAFVPGAGSFYAKAPDHGVLHLAIHVLAVAGWVATEGSRTERSCLFFGCWNTTHTVCAGECAAFRAVYFLNMPVAVVVAVLDARRFNARLPQPRTPSLP
jgi:hypothetical protein